METYSPAILFNYINSVIEETPSGETPDFCLPVVIVETTDQGISAPRLDERGDYWQWLTNESEANGRIQNLTIKHVAPNQSKTLTAATRQAMYAMLDAHFAAAFSVPVHVATVSLQVTFDVEREGKTHHYAADVLTTSDWFDVY